MSSLHSRFPSVSRGILKGLQLRRIMSLEIKVLVLTITLISSSLTASADIIVQPGYDKIHTQHPPIYSQPLVNPIQQTQLIPIYAHGNQGGIPYQVGHPLLHYPHYPHYPYYPHYPQYAHAWPRNSPQKHLRVLKIGGHKVFQPSWYVGQPSIPMAVHRRYKKSIEEQPDSEKSWERVHDSKDSSIDKFRSDMIENEDNNVFNQQSKDNYATMGTLFNMNAQHFMNSENLETKLNTLNERNTEENNNLSAKQPESNVDKTNSQPDSQVQESSSQIPPDEPNLRNFPDPRPDTPEHKTSHKTTSNPTVKNSLHEKPLLGTPITGDETFESKHVQQEYPSPLTYNYYYNLPPHDNYAPPAVSYLPVYMIHYSTCNHDTSKTDNDQESGIQEQIYQAGVIRPTTYPPNMEYTFSPPTYNYVSSYALGHPATSHYATSPYPIPYLQFK